MSHGAESHSVEQGRLSSAIQAHHDDARPLGAQQAKNCLLEAPVDRGERVTHVACALSRLDGVIGRSGLVYASFALQYHLLLPVQM